MRRQQQAGVTLVIGLFVLITLAAIALIGARLALTQHRISANSARADAAFAAAEAGIQSALAYVNANRAQVACTGNGGWLDDAMAPLLSPPPTPCATTPALANAPMLWMRCANGGTALPCGNGAANLYDSSWLYYGPLPNQRAANGEYAVSTWLLSNTINAAPPTAPYLGCTSVPLLNMSPVATVINTVNALVAPIAALLGQPSLGVNLTPCLPVNFAEQPPAPYPSRINPGMTVVASARPPLIGGDPAGGASAVQQVLATTSIFTAIPPAALIVNGTVSLSGDIRIWGNMRPPTVAPMNFSLLHLNSVAGIDVTSLLYNLIGSTATSLANALNLSFAPVLNVTPSQVLAFNWNVTFPLSIWSSAATTLSNETVTLFPPNILSGARTCLPQFDGTANAVCTPLSEGISVLTTNLQLHLPDIQDPANLTNTVTGLLSGSSVPTFPPDLFAFTFGYPSSEAATIQGIATAASDCSAIGGDALYWVSGNCALSGTIGSAAAPVTIVTTGNVSLAAGTSFYGVLYLRGSGAKTLAGPASGARALIRGAVLSEGSLASSNSNYNIAYDVNAVRAAGFRPGKFVAMRGGWSDAITGP